MLLDAHTHRTPPSPVAINAASPRDFNPLPGYVYSIGIHPWDVATATESDVEKLRELARHPQVAAIGETGLDTLKTAEAPMFLQVEMFDMQARLAEEVGKPLIIHDVRAHQGIIEKKKELCAKVPWIIHGLRNGANIAKMLLDAGCYLSYGPKFTPEAVAATPADRILAETDDTGADIEEVIAAIKAVSPEATPAETLDFLTSD